jgi:hypothetical protein
MDRRTTNLLNFLSLSELETLIQSIVRRILRSELQQLQSNPPQSAQTDTLLATFGTWEDDRPVETIIEEIYSTRTLNSLEA